VGVVGATNADIYIYIYIYIYLRSMRSTGKCANTKMKYPLNCGACMQAGDGALYFDKKNSILRPRDIASSPCRPTPISATRMKRTVGLETWLTL